MSNFIREYKCVFVSNYDGDTITIDVDLGFDVWRKKLKVRLLGVDTPEIRSGTKESKAAAKLAKARVKELLSAKGEPLIYMSIEKPDKYGRALGDFRDSAGNQLSETLLSEHLAVPWTNDKGLRKVWHEANYIYLVENGLLEGDPNDHD